MIKPIVFRLFHYLDPRIASEKYIFSDTSFDTLAYCCWFVIEDFNLAVKSMNEEHKGGPRERMLTENAHQTHLLRAHQHRGLFSRAQTYGEHPSIAGKYRLFSPFCLCLGFVSLILSVFYDWLPLVFSILRLVTLSCLSRIGYYPCSLLQHCCFIPTPPPRWRQRRTWHSAISQSHCQREESVCTVPLS